MKNAAENKLISKYLPADYADCFSKKISAKISESDATISGGAKLTLEQGAAFEITNGKTLTVASSASVQIDTDLASSTMFNVDANSGLVFEDGATLVINLIADIAALDDCVFDVLLFDKDANIAGVSNFVKGETLFLTINGETYLGDWDYSVDGTSMTISISVPEPSTIAAIFGALALGLAVYRKRK